MLRVPPASGQRFFACLAGGPRDELGDFGSWLELEDAAVVLRDHGRVDGEADPWVLGGTGRGDAEGCALNWTRPWTSSSRSTGAVVSPTWTSRSPISTAMMAGLKQFPSRLPRVSCHLAGSALRSLPPMHWYV